MIKQCTTCGTPFPVTSEFFYRKRKGEDVLFGQCKKCMNKSRLKSRAASPEQQAYRKAYSEDAGNRERQLDRIREDRRNNPDKYRQWEQAKYARNSEKIREKRKAYYQRNKEKYFTYRRNREAKLRGGEIGTHTKDDIARIIASQKSKCYYCGCLCVNEYHVDHIVPISRGGLNTADNLAIACKTCNLKKQSKLPHEFGYRLL